MTDTNIFDEVLAGVSTGKHEAEQATAETEQATAPAEAEQTNGSEWPKTLTLPVGERPEGSATVAEFADIVNRELVKAEVERLMSDEDKSPVEAAMAAMNVQVSQASFYQAVKAQRNPIPFYTVRHEVPVLDDNGQDTGEVKVDEKTYIPVDVALEFWKNRPTRGGAGVGRSTEEELEKRLYRAGKKLADLKAAQERHAKLTANIERMKGQVDDYQKRLEVDGKTLDDATEAFEAQQESEEAESAIE